MLTDIEIKNVYSSSSDDLLNDFYNPILEKSISYDRITGYFSPKILAVAARGMAGIFTNYGKIRIITSVEVDENTFNAIKDAGKIDDEIIEKYLIPQNALEFEIGLQKDYYSLFVALIKNNLIEMKIAFTNSNIGILHEKIGIVKDAGGNEISFSGSNNETVYGWSQNIEDFKVFKSWEKESEAYIKHDRDKFEQYWSNKNNKMTVIEIDEALKDKVFKIKEKDIPLVELIDKIKDEESKICKNKKNVLRDYQIDAIEHWKENNYISVFEMATGTGKTYTSIKAINEFRNSNEVIHCVVVVPLVTLVEQWKKEIQGVIDDVNIIIACSINPNWKNELRELNVSRTLGMKRSFIVITIYNTFASENFNSFISASYDDLVLVADEMHNLVSASRLNSAKQVNYKFKLGLSATPTRLWKKDESKDAMNLFGNNSYTYSLEKAIQNKFLVPFYYYVFPVYLETNEYDDYTKLSLEISKLSNYQSENNISSAYSMALRKRAIIKKQAENKLLVLDGLINKMNKEGTIDNTLIYTDSNSSLQKIQNLLTSNHVKSTKFTDKENLDSRLKIIKQLRSKSISAIVAIKCLDEGVDIPSATNGIFLSNNTDPREYVQRLGRVLRKDSESNKEYAYIYDFLVLPPINTQNSDKIGRALVKNELIRAKFFKELSRNSSDVSSTVGSILDNNGYYFKDEELVYDNEMETN